HPLLRDPDGVFRGAALHRVRRRPAADRERQGAEIQAARTRRHGGNLGPRTSGRRGDAPLNREEAMPFYEKGQVRIYFEESGTGFPVLAIPGGGLNSTIGYIRDKAPFNPLTVLNDEFRVISM